MWLPEPAPAVPAVGGVGFAFSQANSSGSDLGRNRVGADNHHGIAGQQDDGREIGDEVVAELVDRAIGDMGAEMADADSVAIGRRTHDAPDAERAGRARDVLDQDVLPERDAHPLGQNPRHRVGRAAGGKRHHHGEGVRGKVFGNAWPPETATP